uniref:SHIRT domain-containing protein n=1 Tax=Ndongobacter massiliensis TaxID=1871025 RepID=UPI000931B80A|nr:SHIRT domain-containing protein [Ndongobacter massiliensis]
MIDHRKKKDRKAAATTRSIGSRLKQWLAVFTVCLLILPFVTPIAVHAEDLEISSEISSEIIEEPVSEIPQLNPPTINTPVKEEPSSIKSNEEQGDGLEIGPEIVDEAVARGAIPAPTINKVFCDATTLSGGKVHKARVKVGKKNVTVIATVHVTLKAKDGTVKATLSYSPKTGNTWKVDLPAGVKVAEGDTVTVYQQLGEDKSPEVTANAEPSMANQITLTMPAGEIWIEHPNANLVNKDEQAEAIEMLKKANPDIAKDFKSVTFSIDGTDHAYYEVTYTDGSTSGKVEATDLKIKQVTETSAAPTIEKVQVTDEQIIVTFDKEVAAGTKFYFVKNFTDGEDKNFCENGSCKVDKSNSQEMSQAVSIDGKKVTFPINNDDLELKREFGIVVKEPHKFRSCAKSEPVITTPDKVAVRDPKKLTDDDKKAIDKAIRDANTVNGKSKLPDGTGFVTDSAFIEFDKDGNVTIISPNDVEVEDWDSNYNPIYAKNPDGTYKVNDGAKVTKFPAKDLVKNIAPKSPGIAVDTDKGEVTITPPAYKDPGDDTDLASYTVTYKDASGAEKTVTATRTVDATGNTTWTSDGATVDANSGVVTLEIKDLAVGATITAKAKDNGGLIPTEEAPLESDPASETLETATVSYNGNGGTGKMDGKKLNKGSKYKILSNAFTAPENQEFDTWEVNGKKLAPGTEITVDKDTQVKAIWKESRVKLKITTSVTNGTIDPSCEAYQGDNKTINYAPADGYKLKSVTVDGEEVDIAKYPSSYTFTNLDKNHEIAVVYELPTYSVTYKWDGEAPAGKDVPKDPGSYHKGDHYTVDTTYKAGATVEGEQNGKKGTWTFGGWKDPNNGTMGDKAVTITGSWTFTEAPKYGVSYDWGKDAPAGKDLPKDNGNYYKGDHYTVDTKYQAGATVEGEQNGKKGTWTFGGWKDPNNGTMGDKAVTITGSWTFTEAPKYGVSYDWGKDAPAGKDLPKDNGNYYKGDHYTVDTKYQAGATVEGEQNGKKGTWTFGGWKDPNNGTMGDKAVTITGSWTFKEKPVNPADPVNPTDPTHPTDSTKPTNHGEKVGNAPTTGDNRNLALWTSLMALAGMGLAGVTSYDRRKRQK